MNNTFKLQVQVYDSRSKAWSAPSQLSNAFKTDYSMRIRQLISAN